VQYRAAVPTTAYRPPFTPLERKAMRSSQWDDLDAEYEQLIEADETIQQLNEVSRRRWAEFLAGARGRPDAEIRDLAVDLGITDLDEEMVSALSQGEDIEVRVRWTVGDGGFEPGLD
jgi:hypothetical protein